MQSTDLLSPTQVLEQVSRALPEALRSNVIIIGSLAAGFHFFSGDAAAAIRTKDVDCLLSPHAKAVATAAQVTQQLRSANWTQRPDAQWGRPGDPSVATQALPMVRLQPPTGHAWFLELLAAPPQYTPGGTGKTLERVPTLDGDFAICSFEFLALVECKPLDTPCGIKIARPAMMALANMLHHPVISDVRIAGTEYKRSNKDLGRVLALAHLTIMRDRQNGTDEMADWPQIMREALDAKFGDHAMALAQAQAAGSGINALLLSPSDLNQALRIANTGLLASLDIDVAAFTATGRRLQAEVLRVLAST
jgi:hypothetical protein